MLNVKSDQKKCLYIYIVLVFLVETYKVTDNLDDIVEEGDGGNMDKNGE